MKKMNCFLLLIFTCISTQLVSQNSIVNEIAPNQKTIVSDSPGDIIFTLDVESIVGDNQILGCEFDGSFLWITGAGNSSDPNFLYQIDPFAGTLINSYEQPALATGWGIRDLTIADGLIYGGNETHFFSFDPETEIWETLFESTFGTIRGLAWDGFHFWTKSFAGALYEFDLSGDIINMHFPILANSTCGIAFDDVKEYLYLFNQNDAVFYGFDLSGNFTGETIDVSSAQSGGLAGGAFYDRNNLMPGQSVLGFNIMGTPDILAAVELEAPFQQSNDVGVSYIVSPGKLFGYEITEPIIFRLRNYGTTSQSNIPWRLILYSFFGNDTINGVFTGSIISGEYAEIFADSISPTHTSISGFQICTMLDGDEQYENDCKEREITIVFPEYNSASSNTEDEYIANVLFGTINNSSGWQGSVANYTDLSTSICIGDSLPILITNGNAWAADKVTCWVDWNQDIEFLPWAEPSNEVYVLHNISGQGEYFDGWIKTPPGTPVGLHRLRIRMTYSSDPIPYGESIYGEIEDYTINVIEPPTNDVGIVSIDMPVFSYPMVLTPKATIINNGTEVQAFTVTISIGDYTSTKSVDMLPYREPRQILFDEWFANSGSYTIEACTDLTGDENPSNDCQTMQISIAEGTYAFGFNYGSTQDSIVRFDLNNPGSMFNIAPIQSNIAISAACFVNNSLRALAMDGTLYAVDPETGDMTFIDITSANSGIAYDGNRFYGCSHTQLFEIVPETGQEFLIGDMGNSGFMSAMACDMYGNMYGFDIEDDNFYSINKITGAATIIGNLGYDFNGLQDMSFDKNTNTCYISGYSSNALKGLFTVDLATGAATPYYSYPNNITIFGFVIPYYTAPPAGPAPVGFMASYLEDEGVYCEWGCPPPVVWIGYDSGENNDGLGGGHYWAAIRFEPDDLLGFHNWIMEKVAFFPRKFATAAEMTFMIWEDSNAVNLVYEQEMTNLNWNQWNEVELDLGYIIDATKELWFGFEVVCEEGEYPMGYDYGPAVADYGDMVSLDGTTWSSLFNTYGLDFNYNLKGLLIENSDKESGKKSIIEKPIVSNPAATLIAGNLSQPSNSKFESKNRSLLGFNVYRDNVQVNPELIPPESQDYLDDFHTLGTYIYTAKAVYENGLSDPSDPAEVIISGAIIEISPISLEETHYNPPELTTQILTITNNGNILLDWEITGFKDSGKLSFTNDVGVSTINAPASGIIYTDVEPVIFTIKNFGDSNQTNIPWEVSWEGPIDGDIITGVFTDIIASSEIVEIVADTIDMTSLGDYLFEACTQLAGDEFTDNDCKTKLIIGPMTYCDASTETDDEFIANVLCGSINNSSSWQGDVADYTNISTYIPPGGYEEIIVTNGNPWASDLVTVWVDWNCDYIFEIGGEEEFILTGDGAGETFTGDISVPSDIPWGDYRMRVRMTYSAAPAPCGSSSYGEVEDYTIKLDYASAEWWYPDLYSGQVNPGESQEVTIIFNSEYFYPGIYADVLTIFSNDAINPAIEIPISLIIDDPFLYPPTNLTGEIINNNDVLLTWNVPQGVSKNRSFVGYNVYRDDMVIAFVISDTTYMDVGLPWEDYEFFVTAQYEEGESEPSNTFYIYSSPPHSGPPQNLQYEIAGDSVHLFWEPPTYGSFDFYFVYRDDTIIGSTDEEEYFDPLPSTFPVEYYVTAMSGLGGNSDTSNHVTVVTPGILELKTNIQLYPNPANNFLMIISHKELKSIEIYNTQGKLVFHQLLSSKKQQINTSNFKTGIYTIKLETENETVIKKLIIK